MSPVTVHTALNPIEAQLVRSRLEAAGFHAFVIGEAAALSTDGYSLAVGGVRVQVPAGEAEEVRQFLAAPDENSPAA